MWIIFLGVGIMGLGLFNLWVTFANPAFFDHLEEMKKTHGTTQALIGHIAIYAALPVVGGLTLIFSSLLAG